MDLELFNYDLPQELIAQTPLQERSKARLLSVTSSKLTNYHFNDLLTLLHKDDHLVLNQSKVLNARLKGHKDSGASIELLLLNLPDDRLHLRALVKGLRRIKENDVITVSDDLSFTLVAKFEEGEAELQANFVGEFNTYLEKYGEMPTPPYIKTKLEQAEFYQTIYAKTLGSVAAPTAGLHFDASLLAKLEQMGVHIHYLNLHVGLGTFKSVSVNDITKHHMHSEFYSLDQDTARSLNYAKAKKQRIIAVGTTVVRTLETIYSKYGFFKDESSQTEIFLYPPKTIESVDALITNFHLPKSTLLMLISCLQPRERILEAYKYAISQKYRFFSFGDAMFLVNELGLTTNKENIQLPKQGKLLLHTCCAICLNKLILNVLDYDVTIYFYNPNITDKSEFTKRLGAVETLVAKINSAYNKNIKIIVDQSNDFTPALAPYAKLKENDLRCQVCIYERLKQTSEYALKSGFTYFATTLTSSSSKSASLINTIGQHVSPNYLSLNFKNGNVKEDYVTSLDLYKQDYCGCIYSKH
jgi:S-adenosylmethionine:tRNA ribosyltransferase-isomerase